jgi:hypothetical protein
VAAIGAAIVAVVDPADLDVDLAATVVVLLAEAPVAPVAPVVPVVPVVPDAVQAVDLVAEDASKAAASPDTS